MNKPNGTTGLMVKGTIGIIGLITVTLTGVFATSMAERQARAEVKQSEHGERLSTLEAFNESVHKDLQRMDRKMDRILERVTR